MPEQATTNIAPIDSMDAPGDGFLPISAANLAISDDEAYALLGLTKSDLVLLADPLTYTENNKWNLFWTEVMPIRVNDATKEYIAASSTLTSSDTPEVKLWLDQFAARVFQDLSTKRDKNKLDATTLRSLTELNNAARNVLNRTIGRDGVRIGSVHFGPENLDPSSVRIDEVYPTQRMSTLRSDGETSIKSSKSMTEISMTLTFPDAESINKRLRVFIAEMYASPITTIEGAFFADVLVNRFSSPEIEERIVKTIANASDSGIEFEEALENMEAASLQSFEEMLNFIGTKDLTVEILQASLRRRKRTESATTSVVKGEDPVSIEDLVVSVPVVLNSVIVATEPNATGALQVVLKFFRFHHHAFEKYGVVYRDIHGNPTTEIANCPWIRLYSEWAYMNPNEPQWMLKKWEPNPNDEDLSFLWRDLNAAPGVEPTKALPTEFSGKFVVASVSAAYQTKLAVIPIHGSKYPTVHVMGKGGLSGRILIRTTDTALLREFHLMKDELDAVSRNVAGQYRDEYVMIKNSVLNLFGADRFIITTVSSRPLDGSSDAYEIELTIEEAKYSQYEAQSLWLHNTSVPEIAINAFWDWLWEGYHIWATYAYKDESEEFSSYHKEHSEQAMDILFGKQRDGSGILSGHVINAAMMAHAQYQTNGTLPGYAAPDNVPQTYQYFFTDHSGETPTTSEEQPSNYHPGDVAVWVKNIFDLRTDKAFQQYDKNLMGYETGIHQFKRSVKLPPPDDVDVGWTTNIWLDTTWSNEAFAQTEKILNDRFGSNPYDLFTVASHGPVAKFNQAFLGRGHMASHGMWFGMRYLTNDIYRGVAVMKKSFFNAMKAVMMRPEPPPLGVPNLEGASRPVDPDKMRTDGGKTVYSLEELHAAYGRMTAVFLSADIMGLTGFNWKKYFDDSGRTQVFNTTLGSPGDDKEMTTQMTRAYSNYPDMPLPTYREFFGSDIEPGFIATSASIDHRLAPEDLKVQMKPSNGTPSPAGLWTRFAPLYSDFGRIPPPKSMANTGAESVPLSKSLTIADARDDSRGVPGSTIRPGVDRYELPMEPGFWFYKRRLLQDLIDKANERTASDVTAESGSHIDNMLGEVIKLNENVEDLQRDAATLYNLINQAIQQERISGTGSSSSAEMGNSKDIAKAIKSAGIEKRVIDLVDRNDMFVGHLIPFREFNANNPQYHLVPYKGRRTYYTNWRLGKSIDLQAKDAEYHRSILTRMIQQVPDDVNGIERLHPAFRIYFVEWDNNLGRTKAARGGIRQVRMMDDLYSTSAITSIHVTDRKDDSAVAIIQVLNTTGTFSEDAFNKDQIGLEEEVGHDDAHEDFLSRMKLRTGVGIIIKMGYTSDMESLKTVFTGRIAEIRPGKVINLTAQGWKTELDQEVDTGNSSTTNDRAALSSVLNNEKRPTPHLGRMYDTRELSRADVDAMIGDSLAVHDAHTWGFGVFGRAGRISRSLGATFSTVEKNIWFTHMGDRGWLSDISFKIAPEFMESWLWENLDKNWYFFRTTMWEATQEIIRANPGLIAAVTPFDTEATLFVGYPDQVFLWRTPTGIEERIFENYVRPYRIQNTLGGVALLLQAFLESPYGTTDRLQEDHDVENATFWGNHKNGDGVDRTSAGDGIGLGSFIDGKYLVGSRLGTDTGKKGEDGKLFLNGKDVGFSFLSESYTGFLKWAMKQPFHRYVEGQDDQGNDAGGENDGTYNPFTFIPLVESEQYDLSSDWAAINSYHPTLARFLVSWFFKLKFVEEDGWTGLSKDTRTSIEGTLMATVADGMRTLRDSKNGLTSTGAGFYKTMMGNDLEGEAGTEFSNIKYGSIYSDFWQDPKRFVELMIASTRRQMDKQEIPVAHGQKLIEQLEAIPSDGYGINFTGSAENETNGSVPEFGPLEYEAPPINVYEALTDWDLFDIWKRTRSELFEREQESLRIINDWRSSDAQVAEAKKNLSTIRYHNDSLGKNSAMAEASGSQGAGGDFIGNDYSLGHVLWANFRPFRVFVHYFARFLNDKKESGDVLEDLDKKGSLDALHTTNFPPWYKAFREYHIVQSGLDIIDNSIVASESQMANACLVRGPHNTVSTDDVQGSPDGKRVWTNSQKWESYPTWGAAPFSPDIDISARRLFVAIEPNATSYRRRAAFLTSNMAQSLRPMYRGRIKVTGRILKPHDIVYVNDHVNTMYGPIEVDVVVHEFTASTGWITTIEPHAFVVAESPWAVWSNTFWEDVLGVLEVLDWISWAALVLSIVTFGGSLLVAAAAKVTKMSIKHVVRRHLKKKLTKSAFEQVQKMAKNGVVSEHLHKSYRAYFKKGIKTKAQHALLQRAKKNIVKGGIASQIIPGTGFVARGAIWAGAGSTVGHSAISLAGIIGGGNGVKWTSDLMPYMPVTLYPVSYRGLPLVAGLELKAEHIMSFGKKAEKAFEAVMASATAFIEAESPPLASDDE